MGALVADDLENLTTTRDVADVCAGHADQITGFACSRSLDHRGEPVNETRRIVNM